MKNVSRIFGTMIVFCAILVLSMVMFSACAGETVQYRTPVAMEGMPAMDRTAVFSDVEGKEWILSEFTIAGETVQLDKQRLLAEGFRDIFTINFDGGRVSGMGAPNRFTGPYTTGSGSALNIGLLASTMMASFMEPEELREHEFFNLLSNVTRWEKREGKLELYSSNNAGSEVILTFVLN